MAFAGQPPPHFQDLQAFCTALYASFLSLSSKSPLIASRNTENFCRFEVWHTLTEFICGHPTRLTSYLFLILEAAGGTSKGSLGLRWSIWQKLLGNPEAASAHYSSRLLKVLSKHQMLSGGRIDFHSCCNFANSTTKMIQHFSYRERSLTSLMYWSCLNIRSRRSQWWWGQQCWLGDRLHEIGGTWLWHSYENLVHQVHLNSTFDELDSDGSNVLFGYVWLVCCPFNKRKEGGVTQRCSSTKAISSGSKDMCRVRIA